MKKRVLLSSVFIVVIILNFAFISVVSAALDLKITGIVGSYNSDVRLKTSTSAVSTFDAYDMKAPSSPGELGTFSSTVGSDSLAIDTWDSTDGARTLDLVFALPGSTTGTLATDWNIAGIGSSFTATLQDYGNDSGYATQVGSDVNMRSVSSTTSSLTSDTDNYYRVTITPVVAESAEESADSGGGGGGGGSAPTKKPQLLSGDKGIFIGNEFLDVYSGLGQVKSRKVELYNEATETISGTLKIEGNEILDLVQLEQTTFSLEPKTGASIPLKIIIPEDMKIGVYSGKIIVEGKFSQEVEVTITVSKQELLFDAGLEIPWDFKIIEQGFNLPVQVTLIPMVDNPRLDVTTSYVIRDFEGREFYHDSDTFLIEGPWNKKIDFPVGDIRLDPGKYVVEMELTYPNGVAVSRSSFEIRAGPGTVFDYRVLLVIVGLSVFVLVVITLLIIRRYKKKKIHKSLKRR